MAQIAEDKVREGIAEISAIFRGLEVPSKTIRLSGQYPERLSKAYALVAKGQPLYNTAGVNAEWQTHPEHENLCRAVLRISDILKSIGAEEILVSGPADLKRLVSNPASYNPPTPRVNRGFGLSD